MRPLSLLLPTLLFTSALAAQESVVHVYNWSDYIDDSVLEDFSAETGIRVVYDVFDSNEMLETKLLTGGTGYDVVVPSDAFLARQIQAGVFQPLDQSQLPNLENLWPLIQERTVQFDPGNEYSVNYMWGTTGLGYNEAAILERMPDAPVNSLDLLLNPTVVANFADCGVYMLDAPAEMIPMALLYIGEDPASEDPEVIAKAQPVLEAVRPYIRRFDSAGFINALADGDICLAVGWSGDVLRAQDLAAEAGNGVEIRYTIPQEGAQMWFDQLAVPADAPHPEAAHAFINYLLRPEVIAKASNYLYYANGNEASQQHLDDEIIDNPGIYPPTEVMAKLYTTGPLPPRVQRVATRLWTAVKTGN